MSVLSDIREGFETVVEAAISGLKVYPYPEDGHLQYPCLLVRVDDEIDYQAGAIDGDNDDARFDLFADLRFQIHDSAAGWKEMDEYRSPTGSKSIRAAVKTDTAAILLDTGTDGVVLANNAITAAKVAAAALTQAKFGTLTELTGTGDAEPNIFDAIMWLYMKARNEMDNNGSLQQVKNDAGSVISDAVVSEAAGTVTRAKYQDP